MEGGSNFIIKEKLKIKKGKLRRWSEEVFGWYDLKVKEEVDKINEMNNQLYDREEAKGKELIIIISLAYKTMWRHLYIKDNMLIQKSRVRWNHERDLNSKFFHNVVNGRARRKYI